MVLYTSGQGNQKLTWNHCSSTVGLELVTVELMTTIEFVSRSRMTVELVTVPE